ncbi:MAG: DpnI domain-containing protein [Alphaproteobacteria bacterium]|nr:DpnI domain-containing protein [Alphaproteobacteria bacterium]
MSEERWRSLGFREDATTFQSQSQNARVWTENWVKDSLFCPSCGSSSLDKYPNNRPVADFICKECDENYELKSQKTNFGRRVNDGAYRTMTERLAARDNPNLILMNYDRDALAVTNLIVVPKHFFVPEIIEPRKPLAATARRAGWQGCNILIGDVPEAGKIWIVRNGIVSSREEIVESWQRTLFLRDGSIAARGWLIEVMKCVERIGLPEFSLEDVYAFETTLRQVYPSNFNIRPKIRQQLQVLRDQGYLHFLGSGRYRLAQVQ